MARVAVALLMNPDRVVCSPQSWQIHNLRINLMKLYSVPLSPFAARVRLSIYRKDLPIEIVPPPAGGIKSDMYLALNPMGQIPTLVLDSGVAVPESATILEYLEDVFPVPSLRPFDPLELAHARLFLRIPDFHIRPSIFTLRGLRDPANRNKEVVKTEFEVIDRGLSYIEHYLSGDPWAVGDRPSIADCALVPVINIVSLMVSIFGQPDLIGKYKKLDLYWQAAKTDEINAKVIAEQLAAL
ncbi:glutathione S-transferase family protein [Chamaesiphon sp.]|uniref:glutathione S-transferase family protein n=1 Tax=Chamaesiphon sp. TaxID=2814140 RepID=UPI00359445BF